MGKCKDLIKNQKDQLAEKEKQIEADQQVLDKYAQMKAEYSQLQETFKSVKLDYEERLTNLNEKNSILLSNLEKSEKKHQVDKSDLTQKVSDYKQECETLRADMNSLSTQLKETQVKNENLTKLNEKVLANLRNNNNNEKKESELKKMNDELVEEKHLLKSNFHKIESEMEESLKAATEREKLLVICKEIVF